MGMIRRYFERLASILRPKRQALPAVSADSEGLQIGSERVAWGDVRCLQATKHDVYVGDFLTLAIFSADGRVHEINEDSPGWKLAGHAIEQFLPSSLPHAEWTLKLMGSKPGESMRIYP